ncbi:hypothetical protein MKX03_016440, partial [Papaver bracteatum]
MAGDSPSTDRKGKKKMMEIEEEGSIRWYPREYGITRLPYGIPFPQGCESPGYESDFSWYLNDMQHNVDVKLEVELQGDTPPGAVLHELMMDSPVDWLRSHFVQIKVTPREQEFINPFADLHNERDIGSSAPKSPGGNDRYVTGMPRAASHPQMGNRKHWVMYAFHPKFGPFEVHEGVAIVADRFLISGVSRIGYQSITLESRERGIVRQLDALPIHRDEPMRFPVLDALCPTVGNIGRSIFAGTRTTAKT